MYKVEKSSSSTGNGDDDIGRKNISNGKNKVNRFFYFSFHLLRLSTFNGQRVVFAALILPRMKEKTREK